MKSQILIEDISADIANMDFIQEAMSETEKNTYLKGIFMQAEVFNKNKRRYPLSELSNVVSNAKMQIMEFGGIFGELDHPNTLNINMDRVSHVIRELYVDGTNVIGKAQLLNTPMGLIAQELAKSKVRYGVSSRGAGQVNEDGSVSSYAFVTCDIVANPSAHGAIPMVVNEHMMDSRSGQKIMTLAESLQHDKKAQQYFTKEIQAFIDKLKLR